MKRMIFHIPLKLDPFRFSASQIRPVKMINAFRDLGYEVDIVEGNASERKQKIEEIRNNIEQGFHYEFLYSESSTMPTLLTEKHHCPIHPFLDFSFFKFCKKNNIKIGLFYRDIFWRFKNFDYGWKSKIAYLFYRYDLIKYSQLVDVLFLPSLKMLQYIPFSFSKKIMELPAGVDLKLLSREKLGNTQCIEILYVGGIGGIYNLKLLLKVVASLPNLHLTVCCRLDDWLIVKSEYEPYLNDNIAIVHLAGKELDVLYMKADLCSVFFELSDYLRFAIPYKFFEAISYGCPVLAMKDSGWADFVVQNRVGIVCDYDEKQLYQVLSNPNLKNHLINLGSESEKVALYNTWKERCKLVQDMLVMGD